MLKDSSKAFIDQLFIWFRETRGRGDLFGDFYPDWYRYEEPVELRPDELGQDDNGEPCHITTFAAEYDICGCKPFMDQFRSFYEPGIYALSISHMVLWYMATHSDIHVNNWKRLSTLVVPCSIQPVNPHFFPKDIWLYTDEYVWDNEALANMSNEWRYIVDVGSKWRSHEWWSIERQ